MTTWRYELCCLDEFLIELEKFVKPKPDFKVGDRVRVYTETLKPSIQIIRAIKDDYLLFESFWVVHKKQCRRLKKKEKL